MQLRAWFEAHPEVSRSDFADLAFVQVAAVNHWCNGRRMPSEAHLEVIAGITAGDVTETDCRRAHAAFKRRIEAGAVPVRQTKRKKGN